jgi:hypothetical protein
MTDKEMLDWKVTVLLNGKKVEVITASDSSIGARRLTLKRLPDAHVLEIRQYHAEEEADMELESSHLSAIYTNIRTDQFL